MSFTDTIRELDQRAPAEAIDLLLEVADRNRVLVTKTRAGKTEAIGDTLDSTADLSVTPRLLAQADSLRIANGLKGIYLPEAFRACGLDLRGVVYNLRTNVGIDYCATQLGGSAATAVAKYLAVSNNTNSPAAANTSLNTTNTRICWGTASSTDAAASTSRGEYTALGFARAAATYAHTGSATSFTQTITYTATGAATNLQCCGIFDNASQGSGTLFCENTYTATTFATNDQLTITWTFNI